ncbi:MAG TPA: PKD domain-containing protein, partial [Bacteroidia bacterium]|nr:PKD domain-containing protein [Bacteroidia bacterium]
MSLFYQRITLLYILCICLFFNELTWSQSLSPVLPKANSLIAGKQVQFRWNGQTTAKGYELQISTDSTFSSVEYSLNNISSTGCKQTLSLYGKYYWRFRANYGTTTSNWSRTSSFNSFEPIQYASLNMWLAADSGLVTDANAKLSTWHDLSGKNNSLTQANASERPSIQTGLNNLPAVHFDGVDDQMLSANAIKVGTVFSLFNWTGTSPLPDYNGVMTALGGSNEVFFIGTQGSTSLYSAGYFASQVFVNQTQTFDLAPLSNYKILSGVQPSPISTFNGIRLASDRNFGGRFWNGNFLENLVFDTILTPTQYTAVYNYLSYKYAPPVDLGPDKIVCSLPITLKASKNYFTSYTWNNATTADSLVINAPGTYALTTTDIFNKTTSDTIVISQDVAAYTVNLGNDISICQGQQVVLTAGDAHLTYVWSTGATSNSIVVDSTAVYSVTVTDCLGNITNDAILVTVAPLPEFSLGADTLFCYNAAYKLSTGLDASVPGTYSFLWSDASIDSILVPQASGNFSVKVTDAIGCIFADSIHVTIDSLLYTASLGPDTAFCSGNYIQLSQGAANVQTYLWSDSSTLPTLQVNQPTGVYTYSVVVSNSNACQKSDTIVVSVSGVAPQINFSNTASICFGDTVFFTDLSVPPVGDTISAYSWEFGDNSTSQMQHPTHLYAAAGDYIVKLTVIASNGCSASISKTITVHPLPIADFTSSVAYALSAVQFTNTSQLFLNPL